MDAIDYKQVAQNVLKLLDANARNREIVAYVDWELGNKRKIGYEWLCKSMFILGLRSPTLAEWKNR